MFGMKFTPYSETLQTRLDEQLGSEWKVEIETNGVSGELVTAGFRQRMEVLCEFLLRISTSSNVLSSF